jgi:hypothetical protein
MSNDMEKNIRSQVLLAFQSALLGSITPDIRGITVKWSDRHIDGVFIYDHDISEIENELISDVEGEVISHFIEHTIQLKAVGLEQSINLNDMNLREWVYRRME